MVVTSLQSEESHQSVTEYRLALEVLNLTGNADQLKIVEPVRHTKPANGFLDPKLV